MLFLKLSLVIFTIGTPLINGETSVTVPRRSKMGELKNLFFKDSSWTRNSQMEGTTNDRHGRFLSLFTYIQFNNEECVGTSGESGTCVTASDCTRRGGTAESSCAGGYGVCCIFLTSCGSTVRENGTYFVNNGYPNQYDGSDSCQLTILKSNSDICQYRLEFVQFSIMGPEEVNHICNNDQLIVTGSGPVPTICGNNVGNHVYLDAGSGVNNPVILSVITSGPSYARSWKIRILQIPCSSDYKADDGCTQYFTGVAGQILSFNYDPVTGAQLSNQDYSICIRTERNFCSIHYTQCSDFDAASNRSQSFTLSGNSNNRVQAMVGSSGGSNFCQADYLIIPMASNVGRPATGLSTTVDRICGGVLSADVTFTPTTVRSSVKPFRLWFHSDGVEVPNDVNNKGFCLNYVQQPCTSNLS